MKILFPRMSGITLDDWLEYHPYDKEAASDHYYLTLCNDIQDEIFHIDTGDNLVGADYKYLSLMLTCYFEDMVSQTGIWTSFINANKELYGKYLPFYDTESRYKYGDINLADIQFLIWHFCSNLSIYNHLIDPYALDNEDVAMIVFNMLDDASSGAPRNEDLRKFLVLNPESGWYEMKPLLEYVCFNSYLNYYYQTTLQEEILLELKNRKGVNKTNIGLFRYNRRMELLFNSVAPLLAFRSVKILANLVGASHPLYKKLLNASGWKEGVFYLKEANASYLKVEHAASGTLLDIRHQEQDVHSLNKDDRVRLGIVRYDHEWWLMSRPVMIKNPEIKTTEDDKYLFSEEGSQLGIVKRQEDCFLEITGGNQLAFLGNNKRSVFSLIDETWDLYHRRYGYDLTDRKLYDVHSVTFGVDDDLENLVVFFNTRTGMEFYPDMAQSVSDKDNPYYVAGTEADIENLLFDENISPEFVTYLLENRLIEIEPISGSSGFHYVWNNYDFLLRYWKKENYYSKPKLLLE